jgi:hypothetical protein
MAQEKRHSERLKRIIYRWIDLTTLSVRHVDYVHYNPVKCGLAEAVEDWPWSTYHRFVRDGFYEHRVLNDYDGCSGEDFAGQ